MGPLKSLFILLVAAFSLTLHVESRSYSYLPEKDDDTEELGMDYIDIRDDTEEAGADYMKLDDYTEDLGADFSDLRDDTDEVGTDYANLGDDTDEVGTDYTNLGDDTDKVGADYINLPTCGKSSAAGSRVVSGTDAAPGEWPWQAKLRTKDSGFVCGGSLITPTWVMTAAHCVSGSDDPSEYSVTMGDLNREEPDGTEQEISVKRVVVHPNYNSPIVINNDIALLQLTRSASKTSFVNTVCLPDESDVVPVGTKCYISGWGQMTHPDDAAIKLQQAPMPVVSNRVCQAKHLESPISSAGKTAVTSAMLCAGDAGKTKISGCFGDSGGPFVCQNTVGQWVQQGIVSWGDTACSSKSHFTVFARVSVFRQWIEDTINE